MKRHTTKLALFAGVCAAALALAGCDDEPNRADTSTRTGDQVAADKTAPDTAPKPAPKAAPDPADKPEADRRDAERRGADTARPDDADTPAARADAQVIQATLKGPVGRDMGTVRLVQNAEGKVVVRYRGSNLPAGEHAIHFHAKGVCDGPDFETAGDHWRPANWSAEGENADIDPGHLGTLTVKEGEPVRADFVNAYASLKADAPNTLFDEDGVAVVVHAKPDANAAKPGGDAGKRIACAVIRPNRTPAPTPEN